jgi:flagellar biosynthetic protein FliR
MAEAAQIETWAFALVLALARIGAACMLLAGIGENEVPAYVRATLALALSLLLLPALAPLLPPLPPGPAGLAALLAGEVLIGLWLGWLARLAILALPIAGQIVAHMIGLSTVLQPDPALGAQSTALERLFLLAAATVALGSGLYAIPLAALAGLYQALPPGAPFAAADAVPALLAATDATLGLALQLAAPFVVAATAWQVLLGLLVRLVPRLQVFLVALPGQILGGLLLLALLGELMLGIWFDAARATLRRLPGLG